MLNVPYINIFYNAIYLFVKNYFFTIWLMLTIKLLSIKPVPNNVIYWSNNQGLKFILYIKEIRVNGSSICLATTPAPLYYLYTSSYNPFWLKCLIVYSQKRWPFFIGTVLAYLYSFFLKISNRFSLHKIKVNALYCMYV